MKHPIKIGLQLILGNSSHLSPVFLASLDPHETRVSTPKRLTLLRQLDDAKRLDLGVQVVGVHAHTNLHVGVEPKIHGTPKWMVYKKWKTL